MLFLAEQDVSRLMIFEQRCALLINFRIKFNLIFAGAPSIHRLVTLLSMLSTVMPRKERLKRVRTEKTGKRGFKMYEANCDVSVSALNRRSREFN